MKNKFIKISLIILLFFCIGLFSIKNIDIIKADSGWDSDYDSSWDSGSDWGSSSWDDDYDYDYDDDYDDDWDSGSSSSSGTSSKKAAKAALITFTVTFAFVFFIVIMSSRKSRKFYSSSREQRRREYLSRKNEFKQYNKLTIKQACKIIPDFDIEEFNFKAYQIFYDVQNAWMEFDYDKLKESITDELYNSYVMDLDVLKTKKQKNTMKGFELINSYIFDLKEENNLYIAKVYLEVKFYDYIEDTNTGKVLRGTQDRKLNNTYVLTFIKTKNKSSNMNECPRCGAPVEGNNTGICEYCKSKLINENHDWVMSKKEKISQK